MQLRISKRKIKEFGMLCLLIPYIFPNGVRELLDISLITNNLILYVTIFLVGLSMLLCVMRRVYQKVIIPAVIVPIVSMLILFFVTNSNGGDMQRVFYVCCLMFGPYLWFVIAYTLFQSDIIHSMVPVIIVYVILNLLFYLINPNFFGQEADYRRYLFISNDNSIFPFLFCGFVLVLISYSLRNKDKKRVVLFFAILFGSALVLVKTVTGMLIFILAAGLCYFKQARKKVAFWKIVLFISIFFIVIIGYNTRNFLSEYISFLGKDMTFSGRTYIWAESLMMISQKPILGHGILETDLLIDIGSNRSFTAHNMFFQYMIWGGVVYLISMMVIYIISAKGATKLENKVVGSYINIAILGMFLYYLFEVHIDATLFYCLIAYPIVATRLNCVCAKGNIKYNSV